MTPMKLSHFFAITILLASLLFTACTNNSTEAELPDDPDVTTIQIDNMGATAYVVLGIDGEGATTSIDEQNADIALKIGDRFRFNNVAGASNHPLDFRNSDRDKLFGQSNAGGIFDDDSDVNVQTEGNIISFTLTESLAAELNGYVCSFHPGMNGEIKVAE